jgi:hypothetical protein
VGIVGAGIFGLSCAFELDRDFDVVVFEQQDGVLRGATYANHNRHHYGFHYPRSAETALQCLASRESFEGTYGDCLAMDFPNYYCVAAANSRTSPEQYLAFCDRVGIQYREEWPAGEVLNRERIALCLRVREGIYDYEDLRRMVLARLAHCAHVRVECGHKVVGGRLTPGGEKVLTIENAQGRQERTFDCVINAMYADHNRFCEWFGFERKLFQFNLQELDVIELPGVGPLGVTVQDGPFPSFLPLGRTRQCLLAHVIASQLKREISKDSVPLLHRVMHIESNWENVQRVCAEYVPILNECRYVKSLFVDRVVDATRLDDDARLTDIVSHGQGCWSVFAAKIITCEMTAREVGAQIRAAS